MDSFRTLFCHWKDPSGRDLHITPARRGIGCRLRRGLSGDLPSGITGIDPAGKRNLEAHRGWEIEQRYCQHPLYQCSHCRKPPFQNHGEDGCQENGRPGKRCRPKRLYFLAPIEEHSCTKYDFHRRKVTSLHERALERGLSPKKLEAHTERLPLVASRR